MVEYLRNRRLRRDAPLPVVPPDNFFDSGPIVIAAMQLNLSSGRGVGFKSLQESSDESFHEPPQVPVAQQLNMELLFPRID